MVFRNYAKTAFWNSFGCRIYPIVAERPSRVSNLFYQLRQIVGFYPWLLANQPRVVSIHTSAYRGFYRSVAYLVLAKLALRPVVMHVHPAAIIEFYSTGSFVSRWLVRKALSACDQVIVLTDEIRMGVGAIVPKARVVVVKNPVDIARFSQSESSKIASNGQAVLFMGWIVKEKGVYDLVDAMPVVLGEVPGAQFTFAGNKEVDRLRKLLKTRKLEASGHVPGWVAGESKLKLLHSSDVFVLPSYTEGLPNVLLEAMASGVPVVTTPVGGIPSLVEDGVCGILVAPGDVGGLARAVIRLLKDKSLRDGLAKAAREKIEASYSLEAIDRTLTQTYGKYAAPA